MDRRDFLKLLAMIGVCAGGVGASGVFAKPAAAAQTLFTNGRIYVNARRKVRNLLVDNGTVAAVNVNAASFKGVEVVDLKGAALYPGFCDSHVHLMESGFFYSFGVILAGCSDADSIAAKLAAKIPEMPEGQNALGLGFSLRDYDKWSLADLAKVDAVTGSRPAFLADKLGHNAIINSAAIALCGLTPDATPPWGGKIIVEDGQLTGMLRESAMTMPWSAFFKGFIDSQLKEGARRFMEKWAGMGYTSVVDLMGGPGVQLMRPELIMELEQEGRLPLRVNYCLTIFNLDDIEGARQYQGSDTDLVRFLGCKIFVDGAFAGGQAWTSWENALGEHGLQEIRTDDLHGEKYNLNRIVDRVEAYGINMHYHTQGDMAIGAVIDALERTAAERGGLKATHTLIHLAFPTSRQIARIKRFKGKVVTTVQPGFWKVEDDVYYYYAERAYGAYPIKKLISSGISVGVSTDFSVSPLSECAPTTIMGIAATGAGTPKRNKPVAVRDIVHGLTAGSARTTGRDDTGALEVGRKADLVVYDQDLYSVSPDEMTSGNPKVLATWLGGRKVYEAP